MVFADAKTLSCNYLCLYVCICFFSKLAFSFCFTSYLNIYFQIQSKRCTVCSHFNKINCYAIVKTYMSLLHGRRRSKPNCVNDVFEVTKRPHNTMIRLYICNIKRCLIVKNDRLKIESEQTWWLNSPIDGNYCIVIEIARVRLCLFKVVTI